MNNKDLMKDLAVGSILTGQISEAHIVNMRSYPFVFIDNIKKVEISYDIVTDPVSSMPGKKSVVNYKVWFTNDEIPETLKNSSLNLQKALSVLFSQKIKLLISDRHDKILVEQDGQ